MVGSTVRSIVNSSTWQRLMLVGGQPGIRWIRMWKSLAHSKVQRTINSVLEFWWVEMHSLYSNCALYRYANVTWTQGTYSSPYVTLKSLYPWEHTAFLIVYLSWSSFDSSGSKVRHVLISWSLSAKYACNFSWSSTLASQVKSFSTLVSFKAGERQRKFYWNMMEFPLIICLIWTYPTNLMTCFFYRLLIHWSLGDATVNFVLWFFKLCFVIDNFSFSCEEDFINNKSTLLQIVPSDNKPLSESKIPEDPRRHMAKISLNMLTLVSGYVLAIDLAVE